MIFRRRDRLPPLDRMRDLLYPRRGWRRALEYLGHRMRRIPDTPHRIALGFACGAMVSFTPLFGLHILLAVGLAWALRANLLAAAIGTVVGNPLTFPVIAAVSMALGRRILDYGGATGRDFGRIAEAFWQAAGTVWQAVMSLFGYGAPEWGKLAYFASEVLWPYMLGGLAPGLAVAVASYSLVRPLVAAYQAARRKRLARLARPGDRTGEKSPP